MERELVLQSFSAEVAKVQLGATAGEGGTRSRSIFIGGQSGLPFLLQEAKIPYPPVIAYEVWDVPAADWPPELKRVYGDCLIEPLAWAEKCVNEFKAEALCVRLMGAQPDFGNKSAAEEAKLIADLIKRVSVPLIIYGSGDDEKDNQVLPACCEAAKGERCLIGSAVQDNYKTLTGACLADGHSIIAESPIDINIAKQLNILISEMGLPLERIVINPTIGALGYGLEYAYSIMERARLAGLSGDKTLALPFFCMVAQEAWKAKEAKAPASEFPQWGSEKERGIAWEAITASALIQAGADLLVMRHPVAVEKVKQHIDNLMRGRSPKGHPDAL